MPNPMSGWEALRRLAILEPISYVVQVSYNAGASWGTIAGFDCRAAADSYWEQCLLAGGAGREYRVKPVEL